MIRFVCECGKQLQARDENAGKLAVCPACQRQITVPAEAPPAEGVQPQRFRVREEPAREEEPEIEDRPRRRQPAGNSGKAIASLILGMAALLCNIVAGLPALILGILALREIGDSRGRITGRGLALGGIVAACVCTLLSCGLVFGVLWWSVGRVRQAAERAQSQNNLKQLAIAMLNYNDTYQSLPPAGLIDPAKPRFAANNRLLSWRVMLLPYIGEVGLYNRFKLDEPWDSLNNIRLVMQMPRIYECPTAPTQPGYTIYQVFVGKSAAFTNSRPTRIPGDFTDGTANTILIAEASQAVPWTKPEDIDFDPSKPIRPLLSSHTRGGCNVALADGSVRYLPPSVSENKLKAAITRNAGDALAPDWWNR